MRFIALYLLLFFTVVSASAQIRGTKGFTYKDTLAQQIVLIGDGGALTEDGEHTVADAVKELVDLNEKTTIIYLGDNLYKTGLPDDQDIRYTEAKAVLDSQAILANEKVNQVIFIPGNHDWDNGGIHGLDAVRRQQEYIDELGYKNLTFLPKNGCPGPVEVPIGDKILLLVIDSQWWLHTSDKPGIESDCEYKTKDEILEQISDIVLRNKHKVILLAAHHPFESNGIHGGYFGLKQHIFPFTDLRKYLYIPLPVIGSIYPISRQIFGSPQDLPHPVYQNMVNNIRKVTKDHPYVLFLHGHDHNLQLLRDSSYYYIVAGSGCKTSRVEPSKKSEFVTSSLGFSTLEISENKNVRASFYVAAKDSFGLIYTQNLFNYSDLPPLVAEDTTTMPNLKYEDSVTVAAGKSYAEAGKVRRFFLGNNYREEWATPVKMKVFNINEEKGGFTIERLGGGKQTKSLHMVDKNGKEWKLRTINKDPEAVIPDNLKNALSRDIVQDMISAAHPYGAAIVPGLAKAVGVMHAKPEFFFVPDDPSLGYYQLLFANKVCMLVEKDPTEEENDKSTYTVLSERIEDNDHLVDQKNVLKARLLDILIADWDRHFDQWKFGQIDTGKGKVYFPIPRDRDQALFYSDGLLMQYASRKRLPMLAGFRRDIPRINWMGFSSKDFDRAFLTDLDADEWRATISEFQSQMTDSVIEASVRLMPEEVLKLSGETIIEKLKIRRDLLMKEAMDYYDFLSNYVTVLGSNKSEVFHISGAEGKKVKVDVYMREDDLDSSIRFYSRIFDPEHTQEVRLYGFNDDDYFKIDEDVDTKIKFRIIGGRGSDTFNIKGKARNFIYDLSTQPNPIIAKNKTVNLMSPDPLVNDYDPHDFNYQDMQKFPWLRLGFNTEDGIMAGVGFWRRTYGFRKEPYGTQNRLSSLYSFLGDAYQLQYEGDFVDIFRHDDLVINAELMNPTLRNFYGLGNETKEDPDKEREFYRVRYKYVSSEVMIRKTLFRRLNILFGPSFYHYWIRPDDNREKILANPELVNLDSNNIYSKKTYLGATIKAIIDNRNSQILPTRGVHWVNEFTYMGGLNDNSNPITRLESNMTVYASLTDPARLIAVLRLGGGKIFSENFEYFQALNLGQNNFLRGFRKNRFSGSSMAYFSAELRYQLWENRSFVLPGSFGVIGFDDLGRVWVKNDDSRKWHNVVGGGVYYAPFNQIIVSGTLGFSEETTIFNFTVGTQLNLTF